MGGAFRREDVYVPYVAKSALFVDALCKDKNIDCGLVGGTLKTKLARSSGISKDSGLEGIA